MSSSEGQDKSLFDPKATTGAPTNQSAPPMAATSVGAATKPVTFDQGLIGKWERFLKSRFGLSPMHARALPTFMVSTILHQVYTRDEMGPVSPSVWFALVEPTGVGKSPPFRAIRDVIRGYNRRLLGPTRFTIEGLTEHITGKKAEEGVPPDEDSSPHPHFSIIRDELSSLLEDKAKRTYQSGTAEFLSELWDGYLQGYRTRSHASEGNVPVYVSLFGAASYRFLNLLDEEFWIQGMGNRFLYIDEKITLPMFGDRFFFGDHEDRELETLTKETHEAFKVLETCRYAVMPPGHVWLDWANSVRSKINEGGFNEGGFNDLEAGYMSKQILNSLKLSMIYAASRYSILPKDHFIIVTEADVKLALEDIENYIKMWRSLITKWQDRTTPMEEARLPKRKLDLDRVMQVASAVGGTFTKGNVKAALDTSDGRGVAEVVGLGINKGLIEIVEESKLTPGEVEKFKPKSGIFPQVYRLSKEGKDYLEELGVKQDNRIKG